MNKPDIKLTCIEVHVGLSQETPAYTATLLVDGEVIALLSNAGHGGCDEYRFAKGFGYDFLKTLGTRVAATFPKITFHDKSIDTTLETECHKLVWRHVRERNFRSKLSRTVLVRDPKDGKVYGVSGRKDARKLDYAKDTYGSENVLNLMPFEEAFAIAEAVGAA